MVDGNAATLLSLAECAGYYPKKGMRGSIRGAWIHMWTETYGESTKLIAFGMPKLESS